MQLWNNEEFMGRRKGRNSLAGLLRKHSSQISDVDIRHPNLLAGMVRIVSV